MSFILRRFLLAFVGCVALLSPVFAQSDNDKVIISNQEEKYTFLISNNKLIVKEILTTDYECVEPSVVSIVKFYDSHSTIDKVSIKGQKGIQPKYQLYSSEDIFYSDAKICSFDLRFLKKGEKVQVTFETTYDDPRYFPTVYLSDIQFIRNKTLSISVPSEVRVQIKEYNLKDNIEQQIIQDSKKKTTIYEYKVRDQKSMTFESNMQGKAFIYPHLLVITNSAIIKGEKITYFENLDDLYKWHRYLFQMVDNNMDVIRKKAQEITKDCFNDLEKINALLVWVQTNIRYVAFEDGIAAFKPDAAQEVLRKKYGDCKGMANLLKALLTAEGFDARLSTLGTNHLPYDYNIPSLAVGNHMICTLFYNGEIFYLDPTVQFMEMGEYPQGIQGKQIMIEDGENYRIETIPVTTPGANTDSLFCQYFISKNSVMDGKVTNTFSGEEKCGLRMLMDRTPKDKLSSALSNFLERGRFEDKVSNVQIIPKNPYGQLEIQYSILNKSGMQTVGNEYFITLDLDRYLPFPIVDTIKRVNDVLMAYKSKYVRNIVLNIPSDYKVDYLPSDFNITNELYDIRMNYRQNSNTINYSLEISIKELVLKKENFRQFNSDMKALLNAYSESLSLVKEETSQ